MSAKIIIATVLLLGDSQTGGEMGRQLELYYENRGVPVQREASPGKGVKYFTRMTKLPVRSESGIEDISMSMRQKERIQQALKRGVQYIIVGSLGGNDAKKGCCTGRARAMLLARYKALFNQLCMHNAIVIFNGSPIADPKKWPRFDRRRAEVDRIQGEASMGTCVIRNSMRGMRIPPDKDGYHYNRSAKLYVEYLMGMPGMKLPLGDKN